MRWADSLYEAGGRTAAEVLSSAGNVTSSGALGGASTGAGFTVRAASALTVNLGTIVSASRKSISENHPTLGGFRSAYPASQHPPPLQQLCVGSQQEFPSQPVSPI